MYVLIWQLLCPNPRIHELASEYLQKIFRKAALDAASICMVLVDKIQKTLGEHYFWLLVGAPKGKGRPHVRPRRCLPSISIPKRKWTCPETQNLPAPLTWVAPSTLMTLRSGVFENSFDWTCC